MHSLAVMAECLLCKSFRIAARFGPFRPSVTIRMESDAFDYLDAPLERVTGADIPMPYAINLEQAALPQADDVVEAVKRVLERHKKL